MTPTISDIALVSIAVALVLALIIGCERLRLVVALVPDQVDRLRGAVNGDRHLSLTLPPEARPDYTLEFGALTNDNAISKVYVWDTGDVIWGGYADGLGPHAPISRLPLNFLSWSTVGPAPLLADALAARP